MSLRLPLYKFRYMMQNKFAKYNDITTDCRKILLPFNTLRRYIIDKNEGYVSELTKAYIAVVRRESEIYSKMSLAMMSMLTMNHEQNKARGMSKKILHSLSDSILIMSNRESLVTVNDLKLILDLIYELSSSKHALELSRIIVHYTLYSLILASTLCLTPPKIDSELLSYMPEMRFALMKGNANPPFMMNFCEYCKIVCHGQQIDMVVRINDDDYYSTIVDLKNTCLSSNVLTSIMDIMELSVYSENSNAKVVLDQAFDLIQPYGWSLGPQSRLTCIDVFNRMCETNDDPYDMRCARVIQGVWASGQSTAGSMDEALRRMSGRASKFRSVFDSLMTKMLGFIGGIMTEGDELGVFVDFDPYLDDEYLSDDDGGYEWYMDPELNHDYSDYSDNDDDDEFWGLHW